MVTTGSFLNAAWRACLVALVVCLFGLKVPSPNPSFAAQSQAIADDLDADIDLDDPELIEIPEKDIVLSDDPFSPLAGWWGGKGRLSFKDGKTEDVKCRATYFVKDGGKRLKQNVRCATASGRIEVKSKVTHLAGKIAGTWEETAYNMSGALRGDVTPRGFRVSVDGGDIGLNANMEIVVREREQIIEIQFFSDVLLGLTLVLKKG